MGAYNISPKPAPGPWAELANCIGLPAEWFFGDRGTTGSREAKAVCAECCVRADCLAYALTTPRDVAGIWGGTTPRERRLMSRRSA